MPALLMNIAAVLAAALLGFAAHRGGICTVKAAGEVLSSRRAWMLTSFLKAAAWAFIVMMPFGWTEGTDALPPLLRPTLAGLGGGVLFGLGATVNGACAVSTISRLGDGDTTMLLTIMAMTGGLVAGLHLDLWPPPRSPSYTISDHAALVVGLWAAALLWAVFEVRRLLGTGRTGRRTGPLTLANRLRDRTPWRLSVVAVVIGIGNAFLCARAGSWAYTATLGDGALWLTGSRGVPSLFNVALMLALVGGAAASSLASRRLRWRLPRAAGAGRAVAGGLLMGLGAAAVPGGNDALLLHGIPALSPHALPTYAALFVGCIGGILLGRRLGMAATVIRCDGDMCRSD